jgi:hypothetical protein
MKIAHILSMACLLAVGTSARSQNFVDIEYLPAGGGYESSFGVGFYNLAQDKFGLYFNGQTNLSKREPKYESLSTTTFGDPILKKYKELTAFNLGATRSLGSVVAVYGGVGYAIATGGAQMFDPLHILAGDGIYYVNDSAGDKSGMNVNGGIIVHGDKVMLNVGYHSFSKTYYFGVGASF